MLDNLILKTDSYKIFHSKQYPENTRKIYSYLEARDGAKFNNTVFFGLQYLLKKHLAGQVVTKEKISQAKSFCDAHLGVGAFNEEGWNYILEKHNGRLPIEIKAVEEGSVVPVSNVLMTVENTDDECFWLTNYLETLLMQVWYPTTIATLSRENKKNILKGLSETGDVSGVNFKLHDFGYRGVSSDETAALGGAAHLINFLGTDTMAGILLTQFYYNSDMTGFSIPATEHSTITSWGRDHEVDAMSNMLDKYKDFPIIACVSDSWDIYNACENLWGTKLKQKLDNYNGTLVIRPDSGDPVEVLPKILNILGEKFGYQTNEKGFKVLNKVRVIQGDGIDFDSIQIIIKTLTDNFWSLDNLAFGSGGGLLQKVNRDTMRFAIKCSEININGISSDVFKAPITDPGKSSKKGRLSLVKGDQGKFETIRENISITQGKRNFLETVFKDGELIKELNFDKVRENAKI